MLLDAIGAFRLIYWALAWAVFTHSAANADDRLPTFFSSKTALAAPASCSLDLPAGGPWSDIERTIFQGLCTGRDGVVDLSELDDDTLACNPHDMEGDVPGHRIVSGRFLLAIVQESAFHAKLARSFLRIRCAKIVGAVDLSYMTIPFGLRIEQSLFLSPVNLYEAKASHTLGFEGSTFEGPFNGDGMQVDGSVYLRGGAIFKDEVKLNFANIKLTLETDGSTFEGLVNFERAKVGDHVYMRAAAFKGEVLLQNADIGGNLDAIGSTFERSVNGGGMRVGGSVFLRGRSVFEGEVRLDNARIERNLETDGSTFRGRVNFERVKVGDYLFMRGDARFVGEVRLVGAKIGGNLVGRGSTFEGLFDGTGMQVSGSVILSGKAIFESGVRLLNADIALDFTAQGSVFRGLFDGSGMRVGGSMYLRQGAEFEDKINLTIAQIGRVLQLGRGVFHDEVRLAGASIGGELLLSFPNSGAPRWGEDAKLILRNVTAESLQAEMAAWRTPSGGWIPSDLTGLRYGRLGGLHVEAERDGKNENPNMANAAAATLIEWIQKTRSDPAGRHDTQPYEHLASVLALQGAPEKAREVRYAMRDHQRLAYDTSLTSKGFLWFLKNSVGYGLYPLRVAWWFCGLVVLGTLLGSMSNNGILKKGGQRWPSRLSYSLGNAFPLMSPISRFDGMDHGNEVVEVLFQLQRLCGFFLATILVGALTILAV